MKQHWEHLGTLLDIMKQYESIRKHLGTLCDIMKHYETLGNILENCETL